MTQPGSPLRVPGRAASGILVLADGTVCRGRGWGHVGRAAGEVCFNTSMSGYQEVLTDPSYAGQIITFTFPHIGIAGCNRADHEAAAPAARGAVFRADPATPSNWRSEQPLEVWLRGAGIIGLSGVDTRALTLRIRTGSAPAGVIAHRPDGVFDVDRLISEARAWPGLAGMDLARTVTCRAPYTWSEGPWSGLGRPAPPGPPIPIVAVDYGVKRNILRLLVDRGLAPTVVPATESAATILARRPAGIFLSNGPGDPAATAEYAVPVIRALVASGLPVFGICLGHQLLARALGAHTEKMRQGHRGANQPVRDCTTGKVEITSQNHGFVVCRENFPESLEETHTSLFDGSIEGIRLRGRPVSGVQYHPEASPGPRDSAYLFDRFRAQIVEAAA